MYCTSLGASFAIFDSFVENAWQCWHQVNRNWMTTTLPFMLLSSDFCPLGCTKVNSVAGRGTGGMARAGMAKVRRVASAAVRMPTDYHKLEVASGWSARLIFVAGRLPAVPRPCRSRPEERGFRRGE